MIATTLFDLMRNGLKPRKVHMVYLGVKYKAKLTKYGQILYEKYAFDAPSSFASYIKEVGQSTKKKKTNHTLAASGWTDVYYGKRTLSEIRQEMKLPRKSFKKKAFKQVKKLILGNPKLKMKRGLWSIDKINKKITNLMTLIRHKMVLKGYTNIPKIKVYKLTNLRELSFMEENQLEMEKDILIKERKRKNKQIKLLKKRLKKLSTLKVSD